MKKKLAKARPLTRPPKHPSRRQARKLTTEFHRLTKLRDSAKDASDVARFDDLIEQMGGREEYQRASQTSTSFFSTSKWVLGHLSRNGWLYGMKCGKNSDSPSCSDDDSRTNSTKKRDRKQRRATRLLEVGAINTELIDAAERRVEGDHERRCYNLHVRALDLNAIDARIEAADFLKIPPPTDLYDVMVCSMVLNCVTQPEQRGEMLSRLSSFLSTGGLVFLTLPRTCLNLSPHIDRDMFLQMLQFYGLHVVETKESPKVAFFVLRKTEEPTTPNAIPEKWQRVHQIRRGKKYRNDFAVMLTPASS